MGLDAALRFALIAALVFVLAGVASAILIRKLVGKLITVGLCLLVAVVFWSQRVNIQNCADKARVGDTVCHLLWFDVQVPSPADELRGR